MKRKWALLATTLAGLIVGFGFGAWITNRNIQKFVIDPARYEKARLAAVRANTLGLLQIGATREAIETMESMLDAETLLLTQKTNDPAQLPPEVANALKQIKTYREICPPQGPGAERIEMALARIPRIESHKKDCGAGICRLLREKGTTTSQPGAKPLPRQDSESQKPPRQKELAK